MLPLCRIGLPANMYIVLSIYIAEFEPSHLLFYRWLKFTGSVNRSFVTASRMQGMLPSRSKDYSGELCLGYVVLIPDIQSLGLETIQSI